MRRRSKARRKRLSMPANPLSCTLDASCKLDGVAVWKFGGTSIKNVGRIYHVGNLISAALNSNRLSKIVVVVSAMGDTTDYLIDLAKRCSQRPDRRELDMLLSTGEQTSMVLLTLVLKSLGIRAKSFTGQQIGLRTDSTFGAARITGIDRDFLHLALEENEVLVVAGFQGATDEGEITTLGRGGSDTSAVALAAVLESECVIYTDVDGLCSADPNLIKGARLLKE